MERWSRIFAAPAFHYGYDPGPLARRAVRYHRPLLSRGGRALDAGCGEGQDVTFLCDCNYEVTGVEWTPAGLEKTQRLLDEKGHRARLICADLREWQPQEAFDLVLSCNSLQFLGDGAPAALRKLQSLVAPGGLMALSVFAREDAAEPALDGTIFRWTFDEIMENFSAWHPFEAARLYQWGASGPQPFVTLIVARM